MTRTSITSSPRRRSMLFSAAAAAAATALVASASASGAAADIIARPPFFVPQRADNLILSGGRDAGDWESLHALRDAGLPCYGNMCESERKETASSSAMDNNPGAVQKSNAHRNVDQSYVGHSQPIGSSVEGGAFDASGRLADPAATLSAAVNPASRGGGGSMFSGVGSAAAQEVAASLAAASPAGGSAGARMAWDASKATATATATTAPATTATATATTAPATTAVTAAPAAASPAAAAPAAALAPYSSSPVSSSSLKSATASATMETLAAVERSPTTSFPSAGKKATTPAGGVAFATGEHEYVRADRALDETLDEALDNAEGKGKAVDSSLRLPPAPRGPAGRAAAALVVAAQGAAERVAGAASTGVNAEGQPPADDAEAFSAAVANAAGKVAKKLGEAAAAAGRA